MNEPTRKGKLLEATAIQRNPIMVVASSEVRRTYCLLLGDQIAHFRRSPQEWSCEGINRARHVHVNADTMARLIEQNRATVLDETRGIVALAAAQDGEAA